MSLMPGAGSVYTMATSLAVGWRRTIWGILGLQTGIFALVMIAAAGLGLFVSTNPAALNVVKYAGAAYLAYLGLSQVLSKPKTEVTDTGSIVVVAKNETRWSLYSRGLIVNLLNPKAIVFFMALMPQFVSPDLPQLQQYLIVAATFIAVDFTVMRFIYSTIARPFSRFTATVKGQRIINSVFGALFLIIAALMLFLH